MDVRFQTAAGFAQELHDLPSFPVEYSNDEERFVCPFTGFPRESSEVKFHARQRGSLRNSPSSKYTDLEATVIRKDDVKTFVSQKGSSGNDAVIRFIVRTSADCWMCVTCWGTESQIKAETESIHIGDTVLFRNVRSTRFPGNSSSSDGSRFLPEMPTDTTFDTSLTNRGEIIVKRPRDMHAAVVAFLRVPPVLNLGNVFTIGLLDANMQNLVGRHVNFVGLIMAKTRSRTISTKKGQATVSSVRVTDQSNCGVTVTIWGEENCVMVQKFVDRFTIVFFSGISVSHDTATLKLSTSMKSLLTPYPRCREAESLAVFRDSLVSQQENSEILAETVNSFESVRTVHEVYRNPSDHSGLLSSARIRCYLTFYDLDSAMEKVLTFKCTLCSQKVPFMVAADITVGFFPRCDNNYCPGFQQFCTLEFQIQCGFSDGSGSWNRIYLCGKLAESFIGTPPDQFLQLSMEQKIRMKWLHLMEEVEIVVAVLGSEIDAFKKSLRILDIKAI